MNTTATDIEKEVTQAVNKLFSHERICCLLRYGPEKTGTGELPTDFDFLLVLDTFDTRDYSEIRKLKELQLPIEVFIDYRDQTVLRGIENYRHGVHGSYFVYILGTAKTLIGENFFTSQMELIQPDKVQTDLVDRIAEYFYRIQKIAINANSEVVCPGDLKYIARILTDMLLLNKDIDFVDMHKYHYTDIIQFKLGDSNLFNSEEVLQLQQVFSTPNPTVSQITPSIAILYRVFKQLIKK